MTKNGGRIWAHDWENSVVDPLGERTKELADRCASRCHRAERVRARRPSSGTRSSGELTRARSSMRRGGRGRCPSCRRTCQNLTSRSCLRCWALEPSGREPEDPATGDDETIMQEAAVDIALQLLTDGEGLQALLASDEPSAERVALEGADNALANSRARVDQLYELVRASEGGAAVRRMGDNRQIRVFLVLRYISPLATSRSAVRPWMVRWSSPSSIEPSNSGHRV